MEPEYIPEKKNMAISTEMIKISKKNLERLKDFGKAGDSLNTAMDNLFKELDDLRKEKKK